MKYGWNLTRVRSAALVRTASLALCAALVLLTLGVSTASADVNKDAAKAAAKEYADLAARVKSHRADKDMSGLTGDLKAAVTLHLANDDNKSLRKKLINLIASVPKGMSNNDLVKETLTSLGKTADGDAANHIKVYLKQRDTKTADDVLLVAIRVAGEVPHQNLSGSLLKILTKSKHMGAAAAALTALGSYRKVKNQRVKILKAIVDSIRKSKPGVKGNAKDPVQGDQYNHAGEETRNRWAALSQLMTKSLGKLTGNENYGASAEDWFTMYDDNKRDIKSLFSDDG